METTRLRHPVRVSYLSLFRYDGSLILIPLFHFISLIWLARRQASKMRRPEGLSLASYWPLRYIKA